ncbi:hypothetical protein Bca52824_047186 [Brassica carinata]|uniref:Uncharacterized protein n=1 Tax=Brassica carinata TaxID=52824 RepID=A0A8X7UR04_BRACI|nr:hypothetical protein Bca52824_047186 [Brassica carinata]
MFQSSPSLKMVLTLSSSKSLRSLRGFEMHRFVLREDLHIRSRLSDSSSAMALGLLQILVIKKNIHDRSIILPVVYMILLIGHQTLETRPFNAMKRKCRNGWNHVPLAQAQ